MASAEVLEPEAPRPIDEDDVLFEIVDSQKVEMPRMEAFESVITFRFAVAIDSFSRGLGQAVTETLDRLRSQPNLQCRPDAAYVSFERWPKETRIPRGNAWDVVPDIAIEVLNPTNLAERLPSRVREYFETGVRPVWLAFTNDSLVYAYQSPRSVHIIGRGDILEAGEVLPGFRPDLSAILEGPEVA